MKRLLGWIFVGALVGACGHGTPTGSASNNWATPTGYASATNPRYLNPDAAAHRARNRAVFAAREAPTLQPQPPASPATEAPPAAQPAPETTPPPAEGLPPCPLK